jgi:hypothetical protein
MAEKELPPVFKATLDATNVEYARLGKSGLKVSVPILGAMSIGDPAWNSWVIDEEKVRDSPRSCPDEEAQTYHEIHSPCLCSKLRTTEV